MNGRRETVAQFGEGGFLRGFVDNFIHHMNEMGTFAGSVVVVQPIERGMVSILNKQGGKYHLYERCMENGKEINRLREITSISRGIDPYKDYDAFLALAKNPDLKYIFSNTTEAGIEYIGTEKLTDRPPKSYPAKLTALLYKRFKLGLPGFHIFPCELIDLNADNLLLCVKKYAALWNLGEAFDAWLTKENTFSNTLVDRITPGYPRDDENLDKLIAECGGDKLIDTTEPFALWVIETRSIMKSGPSSSLTLKRCSQRSALRPWISTPSGTTTSQPSTLSVWMSSSKSCRVPTTACN